MSVVKQPFTGFSRTDDQIAQNNLVRLTDADRVRDETREVTFRRGPRDTSSTFVFETNLRGDLSKPSPSDAVEHLPPHNDEWSGLEINQTLGQLMTETRKHSGLSREQVADRTHIPAYYVRMIESDSYDAIPDQLYLLPFFRRYADFLGLDAKKVVSRFICDFEKAENEVVETPAPAAYAKALEKWRQVAAATVIGAVLLPCIVWGIGTMRMAYRHSAVTQPSTAIASTDARAVAAPDPPRTPDAITVSPASTASSVRQITPQPHAQTRRTGRGHRQTRRSRHSRQRSGHLM